LHGWLTVNESYTDEVDEIIGVFCDAAKAVNGSYGIIYLHDDSDKEHFNELQVFISSTVNARKSEIKCFHHVYL